jgi:hypothetical protein
LLLPAHGTWPYKDTFHGFRFVPDGGEPVNIETEIILPGWGNPAIFDGRTFRVVYLQDSKRTVKNEAIEIEILTGKDAGYHDSRDARPVGAWLGIPAGAAFGAFGLFGFKYRKDDVSARADDGCWAVCNLTVQIRSLHVLTAGQ